MDSKTIRHQNLLLLFARYRTQKDFAEALNVSAQRIGHLINATKAIGDATARQLEQLHGLPPGWMDVPHGAEDAATPYAPLPLSDDRRRLLADYDQMTPVYQALAREAVAAFLALERSRLAPGVSHVHQES
ncbi:MAG: helix-turn-helix transcriptional regulator [Candidatus Contendobacter sp.]|nr:helix-turn-helix transcriptional regulator [Candidatus Contendobacter sp.]